MRLTQELTQMKAEIIENIKTAAQEGDVRTISRWSEAAEECESLITDLDSLNRRTTEFKRKIWPDQAEGNISPISKSKDSINTESPKQEGARLRSEWVQDLASMNIHLRGHGKNYHTESGKSVAVAFANELNQKQLIGKWFLGFKDEPIDVAVLLCRDLNKKLHDVIIPISELGESWNKLSRSKGQIKFHIHKQDGQFFLAIRGEEPIEITGYIGNHRPLS